MHQTQLCPPAGDQRYREDFQEASLTAQTQPHEAQVLRSDGARIPVEISTSRIEAGDTRIVQGIFRDITRRKLAERRYRALFDQMMDGLALYEVIYDDLGPADCRCIAVNSALERIAGIRAEDLISRRAGGLWLRMNPQDLERCLQVGAGGPEHEFEDTWGDDGLAVNVKVYSPAPGQFAMIVSDVTERLRTERALRMTEARLRLAQQAASVATWEWDMTTGAWRWSDHLWKMSHLNPTASGPSRARWLQSIQPPDRERIERALRAAVDDRSPFSLEYRVVTHDSSERWLVIRGTPVVDDTDAVTHYIGVVIDITEERRARERLVQAQSKLDEIHQFARIGIWDWVKASDVVTWSPGLYEMLGMDASQPAPTLDHQHTVYTPDAWLTLQALVSEALATGRPYDVELAMVRADSSICWTRIVGRVLTDSQGAAIGLHGAVYDISEQKAASEEVKRHRQRLSELTAALIRNGERERRQAAMELHDGVGQSLAAIKILARQLRTQCEVETDTFDRLLDLVDHSIAGVRGLTNELSPPVLYELGLGAALGWLSESYRDRLGLSIELVLDPALGSVKAESGTLSFRIARELLMNVHRHSGVAKASMEAALRDDMVMLTVSDKGTGFDTTLSATGHGERFGLFSIREAVALAGGTIEVDTAPGRGARVDVRIPVALSADADADRHVPGARDDGGEMQ